MDPSFGLGISVLELRSSTINGGKSAGLLIKRVAKHGFTAVPMCFVHFCSERLHSGVVSCAQVNLLGGVTLFLFLTRVSVCVCVKFMFVYIIIYACAFPFYAT